jgi:two-component system LytT family response regulator
MEKYRCVAIDDDLVYLEIFKKLAERVESIDLVGTFSSAIDGAVGVSKLKPQILFLDIEMPYLDGYETISTLEDKPKIVIVSSHLEYETDELKIDVSKYVRKPFEGPEQLAKIGDEIMGV